MKKTLITLIVILTTTSFFAQKIKLKIQEGSWDNIKHISKYDVNFDYSDLKIYKNGSEKDYLENENFKNELFERKWFNDRHDLIEPEFIISFNKRFDYYEVVISQDSNSKYIFKLHSTRIYPGFANIFGKPSELDGMISIYEKTNPEKILFKASFKKVSAASTFIPKDLGDRITQSYAVLGREFAKKLLKVYEYDSSFKDELNNEEVKELGELSVSNISTTNKIENEQKCDIIYRKDSSEIKSKVIEITDKTIKYKKIDQLEGPLRNILVKDVFMIIYKNGAREVFK